MPVHRTLLGERVLDQDAHPLALTNPDLRHGDPAVGRDGGVWIRRRDQQRRAGSGAQAELAGRGARPRRGGGSEPRPPGSASRREGGGQYGLILVVTTPVKKKK